MNKEATHCCKDMIYYLGLEDEIIHYSDRLRKYGIPVTDGGSSSIVIRFCPWCGHQLPSNLSDAWFDAIEKMGLEPGDPNIPSKYLDGSWWRDRCG